MRRGWPPSGVEKGERIAQILKYASAAEELCICKKI